MANKQNSKYTDHILDAGHTYNTVTDTLEILNIKGECQLLNPPEHFYVYNLSKLEEQTNDTYTDTHNHIFDLIIKTHLPQNVYPKQTP
jgi:hypothetical protein